MPLPVSMSPAGGCLARLCGVSFLLLCATPSLAQESGIADWSGPWETRWRDGGARLIPERGGSSVTGGYPLFDRRIKARAAGRELRCRWMREARSGSFVFVR